MSKLEHLISFSIEMNAKSDVVDKDDYAEQKLNSKQHYYAGDVAMSPQTSADNSSLV